MATSITPATLTLTLTGAITLDGEDKGFSITNTIASIAQVRNVIVNVPFASEIGLLDRVGAAAGGVGALTNFDVFIVQNMDDTNFCRIRVNENGGDTIDKKLLFGEWLVFFNEEFEVNTTEAAFGAFVSLMR